MLDEVPLTPAAKQHVKDSSHLDSIRRAFLEPVECHPADEDMPLVGEVLARRLGSDRQVRVGADGTRVTVRWGSRGPVQITYVSPPGGEP